MKTKKRRNWLYLLLTLGVLGTAGGLLALAIAQLVQPERPSVAGNSVAAPVQPPSAEQRRELEMKAKGLELVLQQGPDNSDALEGLVKVRLQQGHLEEAISPLEQLAELNTQVPDYTILLAESKHQVGDYEGAFAAYEKVLTANPGNIKALQGMVNLQLAQDRPEGAIGRLQDTLKLAAQANFAKPGSIDTASIQLLLGQVYVRQDRLTEAIAVYDRAIEANPKDFRPIFAKAVVLQDRGEASEAKALLAQAETLAPPKYKDQIKQMLQELPTPVPEVEEESDQPAESFESPEESESTSATENSTEEP